MPFEAAVSATPTPRVVGTTQNRARPVANSRGCRGMSIIRNPKQGVMARMATKPYSTPTQWRRRALQAEAQQQVATAGC